MIKFMLLLLFLLLSNLALPESAIAQEIQRFHVQYEGHTIEVEGFLNKQGNVVWRPDTPFNARARERRSKPQGEPVLPNTPGQADPRLPDASVHSGRITPAEEAANWLTMGVLRQGIKANTYTAETPEATRFVAEAANGKAEPKTHVTIIGDADERARVVNDIKTNPAFDSIRSTLLVQDYAPSEWPVDPALGFIAGKPAIVVQASKGADDPKGGRVIYRTLDYSIGAEGLAEAIRKADPKYKPDLDPGPGKPALPGPNAGQFDGAIVGYWVFAVSFLVLLFLPNKRGG